MLAISEESSEIVQQSIHPEDPESIVPPIPPPIVAPQLSAPSPSSEEETAIETVTNEQEEESPSPKIAYIYSKPYSDVASQLPSNINRSKLVHSLINAYGLLDHMDIIPPKRASNADLKKFHDPDYIDFLFENASTSTNQPPPAKKRKIHQPVNEQQDTEEDYCLEHDCPLFPSLPEYVTYVAGGTLTAAQTLLLKTHSIAIHWDGGRHHAQYDQASGFCYVNDIVLGILELQKQFDRILYIDVDVHHGDGVENAFAYTNKVATVSFHQHEPGFFPGSGDHVCKGSGKKGKYYSINVPLKRGLSTNVFTESVFKPIINSVMEKYAPQAIVLQCGVDGLVHDKLVGQYGWNLSTTAFTTVIEHVLSLRGSAPVLILGGGGYHHANAAKTWAACTDRIIGKNLVDLDKDIPEFDYWEYFKPEFGAAVESGMMKDENLERVDGADESYIDWIVKETLETISHIQ